MKRNRNLLSAAAAAVVLGGLTGCDTIRDYSVNSYQGVLPMGDFRPSGSVPTTISPDMPKPSVPTPAPAASPAAAESGVSATKPADSATAK